MTTARAAAHYLAQHVEKYATAQWVVFNPDNKPLEALPAIFGFNNGGSYGWMDAVAITEDGHVLGSHVCTEEGYMPHDLGVIEGTRPDRHEVFRAHYPGGYRMEFVKQADVPLHGPLQTAIQLHSALPTAKKEEAA